MCEDMGGHLATAETIEELRFLSNLTQVIQHQRFVWLGATDAQKPGQWTWLTGVPQDPKLPTWRDKNSSAGQHCAILQVYGDQAAISDLGNKSDRVIGFVCEWE